ncbi:hypothetical protein [Streptomyces badius]|uniref:Uncharacterized protein n=1 Tax=Streptomyces badius TaxID=1941 RepID=A0ABQ2TNV5_STRBA|nr:hypothetical protein [Streptomyces badius]GGS81609.1 hypothetical protein GCM10010253_65340 [Streptomyces badius]
MTPQQNAATEDHIRSAVTDLILVFESLGAEHQALTTEEAKSSAKDPIKAKLTSLPNGRNGLSFPV